MEAVFYPVNNSTSLRLRCTVEPKPIGSFHYLRGLKRDRTTAVQVIVFPFLVEDQAPAWKEQGERSQQWFGYEFLLPAKRPATA